MHLVHLFKWPLCFISFHSIDLANSKPKRLHEYWWRLQVEPASTQVAVSHSLNHHLEVGALEHLRLLLLYTKTPFPYRWTEHFWFLSAWSCTFNPTQSPESFPLQLWLITLTILLSIVRWFRDSGLSSGLSMKPSETQNPNSEMGFMA